MHCPILLKFGSILGLVIKAENDLREGQPQVAVRRQLPPFQFSVFPVHLVLFLFISTSCVFYNIHTYIYTVFQKK